MLNGLDESERTFLKGLEGQLVEFVPVVVFGRSTVKDTYKEIRMSEEDIRKVLDIVEWRGLFFAPSDTGFGFEPGFTIGIVEPVYPGVPPNYEHLLIFQEKQLPEGWDFGRLSEYFMTQRNLGLANILGREIVNDRARYVY